MEYWKDRKIFFVTAHQKEEIVRDLFEHELQMKVESCKVDTDRYGTFSGDVEREGSQEEVLVRKAKEAAEIFGKEHIYLSSEGAFYPSPRIPFVNENTEMLFLYDPLRNVEIKAVYVTLNVKFLQEDIQLSIPEQALKKFGFPQEGIILKGFTESNQCVIVRKNFESIAQLEEEFQMERVVHPHLKWRLESDMRAHMNSVRRMAILNCAEHLIQKMKSLCPQCSHPGFSVTKNEYGLPCSWCGTPTDLLKKEIFSCSKCGYSNEINFPRGIESADPGNCYHCNP